MVFYIAVSFLSGILCARLRWNIVAAVAGLIPAGVVFLIATQEHDAPTLRTHIVRIAWCALCFLFGACYLNLYVAWHTRAALLPFGTTVDFTAIVSGAPMRTDKYEIIPVASTNPSGQAIALFESLKSDGQYKYGDLLQISGKIESPKTAADDPAMFFANVDFVAADKGSWLVGKMIGFKTAILKKFDAVLPQDEAALLGGITVGGTAGMSSALKDAMSVSGTSYITTMYGFKIAIITLMLGETLAGILPRRMIFLFAVAVIVLFLVMSGGSASAARAGIMSALALFAKESGRIFNMKNALALSATGMALFDPRILMEPAFQLSFLSILGIVYLAPPLKTLIHYRSPGILEWRENAIIAATTLAAIMPVILADFGSFSLTAFFSNTFIMMAVLPLMVLGLAVASLGALSYYLSFFVAKMAEILLWYQLGVIKIFTAFVMPLPTIFGTPVFAVAYYCALIAFAARHETTQRMAIE